MTPYFADESVTVHHGDCLDVMAAMPDASVDAVVTDPPYLLSFMGRAWDSMAAHEHLAWHGAWAAQCLRVLKPGGHLLAFGGSRTWHRLAVAVEDAGFEVRDSIAWLYGSGFPKSLDVSKAIDRAAGATREVTGRVATPFRVDAAATRGTSLQGSVNGDFSRQTDENGYRYTETTAPATPAAQQWQGWGTALKPSHEPVVCARKPLDTQGMLVEIGSHLDRLEAECSRAANAATSPSVLTRHASPAVRTASAPARAATTPEAGSGRPTPTGAVVDSSAQTGTSPSESTGAMSSNTVKSWRACWVELCELTSTSTTATTTSATTDLRTLSSCLSRITLDSTAPNTPGREPSPSLVAAADNLFAASVLSLRSTLALTATEPATDDTQTGSAFEPIVVARKPLAGTVAANVLAHGTGALNIDGCRVEANGERFGGGAKGSSGFVDGYEAGAGFVTSTTGRWPTNVVLDDTAAAELDRQSGISRDGVAINRNRTERKPSDVPITSRRVVPEDVTYGGEGGASRFFPTFRYEAKAPTAERPRVTAEGGGNGRVTGLGGKVRQCNVCETRAIESGASAPSCGHGDFRWEQPTTDAVETVAHPTVKPLALMRWLVRLVTPPGGVVLEPFAGSGTTAEACVIEGFRCIAIEREAAYLPLIVARLSKPIQPDLFGGAA